MTGIRLVKFEDLEALKNEVALKANTNHKHSYKELSETPTIPPDISGEVSELANEVVDLEKEVADLTGQVSTLYTELANLRDVVDGLVGSGEPETE